MDQNSYFGTGQPGRALTLGDAFEFTADDLAANRSGTATEKQIARLGASRSKWTGQIFGVIGGMVIIGAVYILFTPRGEAIRQVFGQNPLVIGGVLGAILVVYLFMLAFYFLRARGMTNSKVNNVSGEFKLVGKPVQALDGSMYQRIKIGKANFMIKTVQSDLLKPGTNYTAYFTGGGQMAQIVSVEQT